MLYLLTQFLEKYHHSFQVFHYLTLRSILGTLTAFVIAVLVGPTMIRQLSQKQVQPIRDDGPQSHLKKAGTPTMGGTLILIAISISVLMWGDLTNRYVWTVLAVTLGFGLLGFVDDYRKVVKKNSKGVSARTKILWQSVITLIAVSSLYFLAKLPIETALILPFFKNTTLALGFFFIIWSFIVVVGTSNAVNLTDGLDGLAILPTVMVGGALGIFAYLTGHSQFANYLSIPYIPGVGEVAVICGSIVGAGLGFLWFNTYPAQIFMGDVGSLSMGAALGIIAVVVRQELVLFLMGGVFVMETVSVILQVASFKMTGKRIFRMAPIHHHFELKGWPEPRVIVRFWIITFVLVLFGLATLKIR